ncbi:MAG: endonuclease/exonuclease/phosphatase family protein [Planctomycetaceae bacterium]|nr:endonuclease/exonuclease/phosphatase family protein [Planctomycetaceae bacterium]
MTRNILIFAALFIAAHAAVQEALRAAEPVKVLSINVRCSIAHDGDNDWIHRRDFMMNVVRQENYDFIGAQEVITRDKDELNQLRYMSDKLPEYAVTSRPRNKSGENDEAVPIWFRKDRWELDEQQRGVFWLSDTPDAAGSITWEGQSTCPRIVQWGLFHEKDKAGQRTGKCLYFYCTHFDHVGKEAQLKSSVLLAKTIAERKEPKYPAVAVGDFNADENSPPIQYLLGQTVKSGEQKIKTPLVLKDTYAALHHDDGSPATYHGFKEPVNRHGRIDFIFVTDTLKVRQADIIRTKNDAGRYPTDHFPVSAELTFERRKER